MNAYHEAGVIIADSIEPYIVDGSIMLGELGFVNLWAATHDGYQAEVLGPDKVIYHVDEVTGYHFRRESEKYAEVYDFIASLCGANVLNGAELPFALRHFVLEVLDGKVKRPKVGHRPRANDWGEKALILLATVHAHRAFGLRPTRNDETKSGHISASDVVAEAFTACGFELKYKRVKNLCTHKDHARIRFELKGLMDHWDVDISDSSWVGEG